MNAQSPHLRLPELAAAEGAGRQAAAATAAHLEDCAACQARRQNLVADGLRFLASRCEPPPALMDRVLEAIDAQQARPRRGWLPGRGRSGRSRIALIRSRRPLWLAAAGLAAVLAAGVVTAQVIAPRPARPAGTIAVRELAYQAAAAATRQPGVRPGQWVFWLEKRAANRCTGCFNGTFHVWTTADSMKAAWVYKGQVVSLGTGPFNGQPVASVLPGRGGWTWTSQTGLIPVSYPGLGSLPRDPRALDRYLGHLRLRGWGPAPNREFSVIEDLLTSYVMPPRLTAELYRALGDIPGVSADRHAVDVAGRRGVAFRITIPPWEGGGAEEIIMNPRTFRLMGTDLIMTAPPRDRGKVLTGTAILRMALVSGPGVRP